MIGFLSGRPMPAGEDILVLVQGVGYQVKVGPKLRAHLLAVTDADCQLFIFTNLRQDALELFGFATATDRALFLQLLSVSGVGPKTALMILDRGAAAIITALHQADVAFFTAIPRVGKKVAQKIIIELKGKTADWQELSLTPSTPETDQVVAGLVALGFSETEVDQALAHIDTAGQTPAQAIKQALQWMGARR